MRLTKISDTFSRFACRKHCVRMTSGANVETRPQSTAATATESSAPPRQRCAAGGGRPARRRHSPVGIALGGKARGGRFRVAEIPGTGSSCKSWHGRAPGVGPVTQARCVGGGVSHRGLDVAARRPIDWRAFWCSIQRRPRLAGIEEPGLQLPASDGTCDPAQ